LAKQLRDDEKKFRRRQKRNCIPMRCERGKVQLQNTSGNVKTVLQMKQTLNLFHFWQKFDDKRANAKLYQT
jgi:hypothetical protein